MRHWRAASLAASGPAGGTYVIAWGAIVFGAVEFIRGATGHKEEIDPEEFAYHALEVATRLETEGRVHEAIAIYEKIAQDYPTKPVRLEAGSSPKHFRGSWHGSEFIPTRTKSSLLSTLRCLF